MGAMARYIDGLSDEARDRLVEAQSWVSHRLVDGVGAGCLRGHAIGVASLQMTEDDLWRACDEDLAGIRQRIDCTANALFYTFPRDRSNRNPAWAFNHAVDRFGKDRVVRAIKLRASRNHAPPLTTADVEESAGASSGAEAKER